MEKVLDNALNKVLEVDIPKPKIESDIPKPKIKTRLFDASVEQAGLNAGLHPMIARILAARPLSPTLPLLEALTPKLSQLSMPQAMQDIQTASKRIAKAILEGECIGIETDHDCDGQTSHAVLYHNFVHRFRHPASKLRSYIGHRLTEGYGLSEAVADRILADNPKPSVLITADNGSSDEPRIARLKAAGIDVIVTDHHEIPTEGCPKSAYACLNPTRKDCEYGDPYIAGCMVAWLLMTAVRQELINTGYLSVNEPSLSDSLDFVAVGTVADCVSIARSANNRAVVLYGLRLIEQTRRPCWRAFKEKYPGLLKSEDLGFRLGPLLNSDGRLSSAFGSVSFLLSETDEEARSWLESLQLQNENRKKIQNQILNEAIRLAIKQQRTHQYSLSLFLPDGHSGVQGIAASRIKEQFGRPTAIFAPKQGKEELITGSVRGIEQFHVREALQHVANEHPDLLIAFGGHRGAGGLTLQKKEFERFQQAFEQACREQLTEQVMKHGPLEPVVWTDGTVKSEDLSLGFLKALTQLEPYGREFETPVFELCGEVFDIKPIGNGTHARLQLRVEEQLYAAVWFSARSKADEPFSVQRGDVVQAAVSLRENTFRGKTSLDIQILSVG